MVGYQELVESVRDRAALDSAEDARSALAAVLATVAQAVDEPHRQRLADTLPAQLRTHAEPAGPVVRMGAGELVDAVARREQTTAERARYHTQAVLSALVDAVPDAADVIKAAVPDGADDLLSPLGQGPAPRGSAVPTTASPRMLDDDEVSRELSRLTGWTGERHRLRRTVALPADRIRPLLDQVDRAQRDLDHHATVEHDADGVTFTVWTHTLGVVTDLDVALAARIDDAVRRVGSTG